MPTENNLSIIPGLTPATQEVFEQVSQLDCIKDLFLCGGTGQSLQMNHRLSEDMDFELIGLRKDRPELDLGAILGEIKSKFSDAREKILGEDHFLVFINEGRVKLSFFRPENPVKTMKVGWQHNNLKIPTLQELLGMKVYAICVRTVFRDYYDIYCLLKADCNLTEAVSYASYLSRHTIRSKSMYTKLLSPQLFRKDEDFQRMSPAENISPEEIRDYIKAVMENEH